MNIINKMKGSWKEASTLILAACTKASVKQNWNYNVLSLKRSSKSSFMPSGNVFPGGVTESIDSSAEWINFFSHFGLNYKKNLKMKEVPPILQETGQMPKLLSLKITAIRETFEETGILLCFKEKKTNEFENWVRFNTFEGLNEWRLKVQKDASEFLNLCQHFNCCPDINNIHLWSNWLTPTSLGKKRFDTAFFAACLKEQPIAVADEKEIEKLCWLTPEEMMKLCKGRKIWLPPPQVYETGRLLQFQDITKLNNFVESRTAQGCERWMPIQIKTLTGIVSLLPGDDAYNFIDDFTPTEPAEVKMTTEEFRSKFKILHRMEFVNDIETTLVVKNYDPCNGHVLPLSEGC